MVTNKPAQYINGELLQMAFYHELRCRCLGKVRELRFLCSGKDRISIEIALDRNSQEKCDIPTRLDGKILHSCGCGKGFQAQ